MKHRTKREVERQGEKKRIGARESGAMKIEEEGA